MVDPEASWMILNHEFASVVLLGVAGFLATLLFLRSRDNSKRTYANLPPKGPREWPVLGSLPSLIGKELPHVKLAEMSRKYGPIFSMKMGSFYTVVLNDYALIRQAFTKSGDDFSDRPKMLVADKVVNGEGLILGYFGAKQTELRRFSLSALRSLGMGKFRMEETLAEEALRLSESFASHDSQPFVPFHDIVVSVSNIICWLCLGKRFEYGDETFKQVLKVVFESFEIAEVAGLANFVPVLMYLPGSGIRKINDNLKKFEAIMRPIMDRVKTDWSAGSATTCFIEMYAEHMVQQEEKEKGGSGKSVFDDENLFHLIRDMFVAGTETTATTLKWALLYMMIHEDVQAKIHEELDREVGRDRLPGLADRSRLPYTEATLMEVQRIAAIVPLSVPHAPIKDTVLKGYDIPQGTVIIPNLWAVHHDPHIWENPDQFRPERFYDAENNKVLQREELIQFSMGRRKCIGEQLAKAELFIFFTHLMHRFHFRKPEGAPPLTLTARNGATLNPEEYHMTATLIDRMI